MEITRRVHMRVSFFFQIIVRPRFSFQIWRCLAFLAVFCRLLMWSKSNHFWCDPSFLYFHIVYTSRDWIWTPRPFLNFRAKWRIYAAHFVSIANIWPKKAGAGHKVFVNLHENEKNQALSENLLSFAPFLLVISIVLMKYIHHVIGFRSHQKSENTA